MKIQHKNTLFTIDRDSEIRLSGTDVIIKHHTFPELRLHSRNRGGATDIYCALSESVERGCDYLSIDTNITGNYIFSNTPTVKPLTSSTSIHQLC